MATVQEGRNQENGVQWAKGGEKAPKDQKQEKGLPRTKDMDFWGQCFVWGMARGKWFFFEKQPKEEICESQYVPITASFGEMAKPRWNLPCRESGP